MQTRMLGRTGMTVTTLGYGGGQLRGARIWDGRAVSDAQAETILNRVLDAGINFIDTANGYGESEARIGRFISHRRSEYFLATKCGLEVINTGDHDETPRNWTHAHLLKTIDESLVRMKTDYVDLLQLHNPTVEDYDRYEVGRVLEDARTAGKTRFIGVSTTLPHLPHYLELGVFDTFQIPYSALEREHEAWIIRVAQSGAGTIIRGGVAKGAPVQQQSDGWNQWEAARLDDLLDGMTPMEFILRFTLSHPDAQTTIVATINPDHLVYNLQAAERGALPADVYAEAKRRLAAPADAFIS